jgi:hypothetical protein
MATDTHDGGSIRDLYVEFSKASKVLQDDEDFLAAKLAETLKQFLRDKALACVKNAGAEPVLFCYSADETALLCQHVASGSSSGLTVVRKGKVLASLLMQVGWLKTRSAAGKGTMTFLRSDPVHLSTGKSSWKVYGASCKFFPMLRSTGFRGIVIFHLVADRALHTALARKLASRAKAFYDPRFGPDLGDEATLLEKTEIFLSLGCAAHDCQNALKWALAPAAQGDTLHDIHILVESLRNSFAILQARLHTFLLKYLRFRSVGSTDPQPVLLFWQALGAEPHALDLLCELDPWWEDDYLWVNKELADDPAMLEKVTTAILYQFKWRKFVESRFCTVGSCCRALLGSLAVGLPQLVRITRDDPTTTDYHLHGFARLNSQLLEYVAIAGLGSYAPDAVLLEVLDDDRLSMRPEAVQAAFTEEVQWLVDLPLFTTSRLAKIVGGECSSATIKHSIVLAAHLAGAYLHNKLFSVLNSKPWSLLRGDLDANLDELGESTDDIYDEATLKLRDLVRLGYNRGRLKDALFLMQGVPWSSISVEQAHGSCAVLHRLHPLYGPDMICKRGLIHQCRHLFQTSPEEKRAQRLAAQTAALAAKQPQKTSGRHAFFAQLMQHAKEHSGASSVPLAVRQAVMQQHGQMFSGLTPQEKAQLDLVAQATAQERRANLAADSQQLKDSLEIYKARADEERKQVGLKNVGTLARFDEADWAALATLFNSQAFSWSRVKVLRAAAMAPPQEPPPEAKEALGEFASLQGPSTMRPWWLPKMVWNRQHFECCVLLTQCQEGAKAYLVLYCLQSPYQASFVGCTYTEAAVPSLASVMQTGMDAAVQSFWRHTLGINEGCYTTEANLEFSGEGPICVLPECKVLGGSVVSDAEAVLLTEFMDKLPDAKAVGRASSSSTKPNKATMDALVLKHPWLANEVTGDRAPIKRAQSSTAYETEVVADDSDDDTKPDADSVVDGVWASLSDVRALWSSETPVLPDGFYTLITGGAWSVKHKGTAADRVQALARAGCHKDWCKQYSLNMMASWSFQLYGAAAANAMAVEWCRKLQYYFDIWMEQGSSNYQYTEADIKGYKPTTAWLDFETDVPLKGKLWDRVSAILAMRPSTGASSSNA